MRKKVLTRQLAVSVSEETWDKILKFTNEQEISISEWIRDAIEERFPTIAKKLNNNLQKIHF